MIKGKRSDGLVWTNTWAVNYNSWKLFKEYEKYLLIKYEDLITNPDLTFLKFLKFIYRINKSNFELDKKKFKT